MDSSVFIWPNTPADDTACQYPRLGFPHRDYTRMNANFADGHVAAYLIDTLMPSLFNPAYTP
ncbi:MAG: hypothetical protein A3K19_05060 [Lentisphaerae bacterium RIFOXYB12_FULL_65_16]|nr:MAG: hypothetical protein A3K18_35290 [Lentisphaerae bacterium RIFOXYA12_64_32]OGV89758.1 MAG: hypothetical protein A3K19_05060 [Lentisphaerae bacterium RIFOXYB12_FULL_65_16]